MEIRKGSMVGHNQSIYKLKSPVEVKRHNKFKFVTLGVVRALCVSPLVDKGKVVTFLKGTIFSY